MYLGVDIGSLTTKVVLIDRGKNLIAYRYSKTGPAGKETAERLIQEVLIKANISRDDIQGIVATGYGRVLFSGKEFSEITCQARGIGHLYPEAKTIIDIGGQDSKVISLGKNGKVLDFAMNDKCAAGTGRFLEVMSQALEVRLEEIGELAEKSQEAAKISSVCTVFAESEVISNLSRGQSREAVARGICEAVAARTAILAQKVGVVEPVVFTGGVAKNTGVVAALERKLGVKLLIPEDSTITAALGAALLAAENS
ncbi:acyl-CoA dehydratase activase [Carboxydothermus hydrogenoformans]|uniref:(R)-2-hydroxyglutaryl-CoA dehydratase activator n=1 Tax=Carboxydothermus hydrogenoformans (strain ATCC BAA-161 / DSM 6008 / Z-2901) TaxID=246194 RepID=Q3ADT5_CARHZ|nr:acyl-CoA dehydratase activase [Carboxydothermus hydrogenoformans]ABB14958.1 (R)-2-hydroxyglutaryl-CoA dehydratase activator [Carboxydothermus hydrogenoformans Z-2901]